MWHTYVSARPSKALEIDDLPCPPARFSNGDPQCVAHNLGLSSAHEVLDRLRCEAFPSPSESLRIHFTWKEEEKKKEWRPKHQKEKWGETRVEFLLLYIFYTIKVCFYSREPFFLLKEKNNKEKIWNWVFFFFWNEQARTWLSQVAIPTHLIRKVEIGNKVEKIEETKFPSILKICILFFWYKNISHMFLFIFLIEICSKNYISWKVYNPSDKIISYLKLLVSFVTIVV